MGNSTSTQMLPDHIPHDATSKQSINFDYLTTTLDIFSWSGIYESYPEVISSKLSTIPGYVH